MRTRLLSLLALTLFVATASAQLKIVKPGETDDLNGTTQIVDYYFSDNFMDIALHVINEGDEQLDIRVRRTEVDVPSGTEHGVCWVFCPFPDLVAGDQPTYIVNTAGNELVESPAPGDTVVSFSMHHRPFGNEAAATYFIEWIDAADNTLASMTLVFDLEAEGIEELLAQADIRLTPNPANESVNLSIEGVQEDLEVRVLDVLGQRVMSRSYNTALSNKLDLNVSELTNGLYFVSIGANGEAYRTLRLVVNR